MIPCGGWGGAKCPKFIWVSTGGGAWTLGLGHVSDGAATRPAQSVLPECNPLALSFQGIRSPPLAVDPILYHPMGRGIAFRMSVDQAVST